MFNEVRSAITGLRRTPGVTLSAVLAIGLAMGANATIFGLVDGLWFRPPGVADPGSLTWIFSTTRTSATGAWSFPEYLDLRDRSRSFSGVVALGRRGATMEMANGETELLLVNVVSTNFFDVLGVTPAFGRLFSGTDDRALADRPGVVLGNAFWRRRFGGDPSIVGQTVRIGRDGAFPIQVLAVLPERFRDLYAAADRDLWLPPQTWTRLADAREFQRREERWFEVCARRRADADLTAAQAEVSVLAASMAAAFPKENAGRGARVVSDFAYRLETGGPNALALIGLVLLVVAITCVNVANLVLARNADRTRELAIRAAIGATRSRLLRQLLAETAAIGFIGAVSGLIVALWLVGLLPAILVSPPGFPSLQHFQVDQRVLGFTFLVSLATTLLFGVAPSWIAAGASVAPLIRRDAGMVASRRIDRALRTGLVVLQIAVSVVLVCAAGVLARSFQESRRADLGFDRKPLVTAWVPTVDEPAARSGFARLETLPGVRGVAAALRAPLSLSGGGRAQSVYIPSAATDPAAGLPQIKFNAVTAAYFSILGIGVREGRGFTAADEREGPPVIVVSDQFARALFPGRDALNHVVRLGGVDGQDHRIVGVVENAPINGIGEAAEPYFYVPYWRRNYSEITYLVDSDRDAESLGQAVRSALKSADARLDARRIVTMAQYIDYSGSAYRATALLAAALGLIGLLLTTIGVFGIVAHRTIRRSAEFGVRIALGSGRRQVLMLVLGDGVRCAVMGLAIGIPAALVATRWLSSLLFGVAPWDARAFVTAPAVVFLAVCAAALIPAWRAMRVDPATTLRSV